jgi:hypothetical protein
MGTAFTSEVEPAAFFDGFLAVNRLATNNGIG